MGIYVGFDIGGTKCAAVTGIEKDGALTILGREAFATPADQQEALDRLCALAEKLAGGQEILGIGISSGGPMDADKGELCNPPNLPGWHGISLTDYAQQKLHAPALLENDANACALAEWRWGAGKGSKVMMFLIVFTMYFSGGMVPSFLNMRDLGLLNSRWAVLLCGAISTYNMLILRTAFVSIPASLEECAMLDGAGDVTILFRIILPLSVASFAVVGMYYAVDHWNSWFSAMIYLDDRRKYPLQLILREILITGDLQTMSNAEELIDATSDSTYNAYKVVKYCSIVVATVPILVIYPFVQRYFVKGVMVGSVKG